MNVVVSTNIDHTSAFDHSEAADPEAHQQAITDHAVDMAHCPAGEYPPLPEPDIHYRFCDAAMRYMDAQAFSESAMHAYYDLGRAMRAQAAPQPAVQQVDGGTGTHHIPFASTRCTK